MENNANLPSAGDQNNVPGWHYWKGSWHPIAEGYDIIVYDTSVHWELWHLGNQDEKCCPHKLIVEKFDVCNRKQRVIMSKVRKVMLYLLSGTTETVTPENCKEIFKSCFAHLMTLLYPNGRSRSCHDMLVTTLYQKIVNSAPANIQPSVD